MAAKNIDPLNNGVALQSIETGAQDWAVTCGVCHVGGGQMEYDRDQNNYSASSPTGDRYYFEMPSLAFPGGRLTTVDATAGLSATNKAELDCLLCHLADSKNGQAFLKSMGCGPANPMGPSNDKNCDGVTDPGYPPTVPTAGPYAAGTAYDMYNRNLALKNKRFDFAASLGIGAAATWTGSAMTGVAGVPAQIAEGQINALPNSKNCSVCHARDDSTPGLPGMMAMKYGYGNFALISPPGTQYDDDTNAANDKLWFELGCKTGMGKRAHKIGAGPNDKYGMSMFLASTLDADPLTVPNAGDPIANKMPDADVHDVKGMQCASCHYTLGSEKKYTGGVRNPVYNAQADQDATNSKLFPAADHHGLPYPDETVWAIDHQFAQADSYPDTKSKNNLDGTVSCESCHTTRTHPRLTDNGGPLVSPTPAHAGFPSFHIQKIACATCHIPEIYAAPGRLKYRDWSVGQYKGGFRNMLDWNYDLVTGSHKTMPMLHAWLTKDHEQKIYPFLPSVMPIWVKASPNSGIEAGSEIAGGTYPVDPILVAPVKARDNITAAKIVAAANPGFDIRLNGGNIIPLFDGFSLSDSWEIDTKAEIDAMVGVTGFATKLKLFNTMFDVTHGVAPKAWALGGSMQGGCVSCHSSADPCATRNPDGSCASHNQNYSPRSTAFFESYQQPLNKAGMGIGQYDLIKNWFALFADYDCTAMCDPTPATPPTDADDQALFNPLTGAPVTGNACLTQCTTQMAAGFDAMMGFPQGTAMQMGMFDGIAGLQGFAIRETVDGTTKGCNPFAGPVSFSPVPGQSVNNCIPNPANDPYGGMMQGVCTGAAPPVPGACTGGFRNGGPCMVTADCEGALANPMPLLYSRGEARSHFKIALQQSGSGAAAKVTWPISVEKNPSNAAHVASWDQGTKCYNPMTGAPLDCVDGGYIKTTVHANDLLGYSALQLATLMSPGTAGVESPTAYFTVKSDATVSRKVNFDGSASLCQPSTATCTYTWDFGGAGTPDMTSSVKPTFVYDAAGTYTVKLMVSNGVTMGVHTANAMASTVNTIPVVNYTMTVAGMTVAFVDSSTDVDVPLRVKIIWGDGSATSGVGGGTLTKIYKYAGKYTINYTVTDFTGAKAVKSETVTLTP